MVSIECCIEGDTIESLLSPRTSLVDGKNIEAACRGGHIREDLSCLAKG